MTVKASLDFMVRPCLKNEGRGGTRELSYSVKYLENLSSTRRVLERMPDVVTALVTPVLVRQKQTDLGSPNQLEILSRNKQTPSGMTPEVVLWLPHAFPYAPPVVIRDLEGPMGHAADESHAGRA